MIRIRRGAPALTPLILLAAPVCFISCSRDSGYVEPPPPTVTVALPRPSEVTDYVEVTGTAESVETVDIRARVEGFLQKIHFTEGQQVEAGDLLYEIDPAEYQARVEQAKASLATALASVSLRTATLKRREQAFKTGAVSELEVLENRAEKDVATAQVQSAEAELRKANLDLGYTRITAPVSGRVGHSNVDPGNLVGADEKTLLTNIVRYDPIYIYFTISEREALRLSEAAQAGQAATEAGGDKSDEIQLGMGSVVEVGRSTDQGYPLKGKLDFADQGIDAATGTFMLRAILDNPHPLKLLPGLFVRARMPIRERADVLMVSERALGSDQSGRYVLVVDENDVTQYRSVEPGALVDGMRVIEKGLTATDRVITNGVLFARPGAKVKPQMEGAAGSRQGEAKSQQGGT